LECIEYVSKQIYENYLCYVVAAGCTDGTIPAI